MDARGAGSSHRLLLGTGSTHNFKKEIEDTLRPALERQTRADMQSEPSHEGVDKEIAYRWSQEVSAMGNWMIKILVFTLKKL